MQNFMYYLKKYGKDAIIFALLLICVSIMTYSTFIKSEKNKMITNEIAMTDLIESKDEIVTEKVTSIFHVDVKGAIKNPGVYEVESNAIINDVIKMAGGFQINAYQNGINLSKKVADEMVIYVYTKTEIEKYKKDSNFSLTQNETCKTLDYNICECIDEKQSIIEIGDGNYSSDKTESNNPKIININTASIQELMSLSGVGESKAEAIIKYRDDNGKFSSIDDIMKVSGIGEKAFEKIKDFITV